jgi:hypothetical protein
MTDFITSIADRNFGFAATIRPRLSSMFEPSRAPAMFKGGDSEIVRESSSVAEKRVAADYQKRKDSSFRVPERFAEVSIEPKIAPNSRDPFPPADSLSFKSEELEQAVIPPKIVANLTNPHPGLLEVRLIKGDTVGRRAELEETAPPHEHTATKIERYEENLVVDVRGQSVTPVSRPAPESALVRDEVVISAVPFQEPRPSETVPRKSLLALQIPEKLTMEMRESVAVENSQRSSAARLNRGIRKAATATQPDVQVTIGRIEVRAAMEAPPNRPPRADSPVIGLDEYLRRHRQRGGR